MDAIESEHESTFGKREKEEEKDKTIGQKEEAKDGMDTARGITGVSSDGATVWMGGVLASHYEENLSKLAADALSVATVPDDESAGDSSGNQTIVEKTIHVNAAKLPSPVRVGLVFSSSSSAAATRADETK